MIQSVPHLEHFLFGSKSVSVTWVQVLIGCKLTFGYTVAMAKKVHAVGVIFENEHHQILVLRRHPQDPEGATWGLVGGKVEPGETKEQAAIRETQEEISHIIDPSQLQFLKSYHWDREDLDITFEVFKLQTLSDTVTLEIDQNENTEHQWASPHKLYELKDLMIGLYPILEDAYQANVN
jgi:mutator protein MutT